MVAKGTQAPSASNGPMLLVVECLLHLSQTNRAPCLVCVIRIAWLRPASALRMSTAFLGIKLRGLGTAQILSRLSLAASSKSITLLRMATKRVLILYDLPTVKEYDSACDSAMAAIMAPWSANASAYVFPVKTLLEMAPLHSHLWSVWALTQVMVV